MYDNNNQPNQFGQQNQYNQPNPYGQQNQYNQPNPYGQQNQYNQPNPYGQYNQYGQFNQPYMMPQQPQKESFFKKIHADTFHWTDQFLLVGILSYVLLIFGQLLGELLVYGLFYNNLMNDENGFFEITTMYLSFIGIWIVICLYMALVPKNRKIFAALGTKPAGNNVIMFIVGLIIGGGTNMICAFGAMSHKDISIYYDSFPIFHLVILFIAVLVQSSAEELVCRGFMYQKLRKGYKNPWFAILFNAAFFAALHLGNPGVGFLPILDIFFTGVFFSLMVTYTDSIWCAMAAHTAWNYTQNIILGLPNSGLLSPFSIFKLDATAATNSFAYNVDFGLEGTILAVGVQIAGCVVMYLLFDKKHKQEYDVWHA